MIGSTPERNGDFAEWLVPARSAIQNELLELRRLLKEHPREEPFNQEARLLGLLVGIGFSLWRAVFLAEWSLDARENTERAKAFLDKVLLDNAIAYKDDKNSWSFGYYINNARFRIEAAHNLMQPESRMKELEALLNKIDPLHRMEGPSRIVVLSHFAMGRACRESAI